MSQISGYSIRIEIEGEVASLRAMTLEEHSCHTFWFESAIPIPALSARFAQFLDYVNHSMVVEATK